MIWVLDFCRGKRFFPSEMSRPAWGHSIGTRVLSAGRGLGHAFIARAETTVISCF